MPVRHSMAVHTFPHSSANTMCILFDECISAKCCGIHKFFALFMFGLQSTIKENKSWKDLLE